MLIEDFGTYSLFLFVYQVVLELFVLKPRFSFNSNCEESFASIGASPPRAHSIGLSVFLFMLIFYSFGHHGFIMQIKIKQGEILSFALF